MIIATAITEDNKKERKLFLSKSEKYFVVGLDIPLLYEIGMDKECDYIFLVNTTKEKHIDLIEPI